MAYDFVFLLPAIMRIRSQLATQNVGDESVLEKIVYMLEQEAEVTSDEIAALSNLNDPDSCPIEYLPLLAKLLGVTFSADWPESRRRLLIKAACLLWHGKGTRSGWEALLRVYERADYFPWELWKSKVYEEFDYSIHQGYEYRYKAARVDIRRPVDDVEPPDHGLFTEDEHVQDVCPVHVLIRRPGEDFLVASDHMLDPVDDSAYGDYGESDFVIGACWEDTIGAWDDGDFYPPGEYPPTVGDPGLELEVWCSNATCETSCQGGCTTSCETSCIYGSCELSCQNFCQQNCQEICEYASQAACAYTCEAACMSSCEIGCQIVCQAGVE